MCFLVRLFLIKVITKFTYQNLLSNLFISFITQTTIYHLCTYFCLVVLVSTTNVLYKPLSSMKVMTGFHSSLCTQHPDKCLATILSTHFWWICWTCLSLWLCVSCYTPNPHPEHIQYSGPLDSSSLCPNRSCSLWRVWKKWLPVKCKSLQRLFLLSFQKWIYLKAIIYHRRLLASVFSICFS